MKQFLSKHQEIVKFIIYIVIGIIIVEVVYCLGV